MEPLNPRPLPGNPTLCTIDCHVAGAPLRLIVEGFPSLQGSSLAERQECLARQHDHLRLGLLDEPRGHADMTGAVLTTPASPGADIGLLFMHARGYSPFCGHGLIGAVTIAVERALFVTRDEQRSLVVDTVAGPVPVRIEVTPDRGRRRVARVAYRSHPSFVVAGGVRAGRAGHEAPLDLVWADGLFALADGEVLGIPLVPGRLASLREAALALLQQIDLRRLAATLPLGSVPRLDGVVLLGQTASDADVRSVTVYADGAVDRSPSGAATAAVVTVLDAMGLVEGDRRIVHESLWGTRFAARVVGRRDEEARPSLEVEVEGDAWITGEHTFFFDPDDPLRAGYDSQR